ncbi:MAG: lipase [Verrucomicrobiales bacterium]|nr:lipase [Verrucomicrobiales bacterium]|tara:strand:- start:198 stop:1013 length:816 start_codon:yes stop_codon:yes gene_type:complete
MFQPLFKFSLILIWYAWSCQLSYSNEYKIEKDIFYYNSAPNQYAKERCNLDIYYPTKSTNFASLVWFHGGGLRGGEKNIPKSLKAKGMAIIAVNYRLFPKAKCPEYIEDGAAAVAWTFKNIEKYGGSSKKIFISGHSAGGYLSSMIGLDKIYLEKHGVNANQIAGLIPLSGHTITHFTPREEKNISDKQPIIDKFAPLYHVRKDAPPLILITGDKELELLGRFEENAYLARMMKVVKHSKTELYELQGLDHGGMVEPGLKILLNSVKKILK